MAGSNSAVEVLSQRRRCRGGGEAGGETSRRWQRPLSRSVRVWDVGGVSAGSGEPRALCPSPHLHFYDVVRRGPPTKEWLDAPDQGIDPRAQLVVGSISGDQPNILLLDLTLFLKLNLLTLSCFHFIIYQCIDRASSSRSVAIRLNSYNALSV